MLPVNVQLRRLAELGSQRVHELGYQARAVVVGLAEMVGDHARSERLDVLGNDGLRIVQRRYPVLAVYRGHVDCGSTQSFKTRTHTLLPETPLTIRFQATETTVLDELQDERCFARARQTGHHRSGRLGVQQRVADVLDQPFAAQEQRIGLLLGHLEEQRFQHQLLLLLDLLLLRRRSVLSESHCGNRRKQIITSYGGSGRTALVEPREKQLPLGSIGPLIVPDLADLLVGCRLDLNGRKSSTEPACNAEHTQQTKHTL